MNTTELYRIFFENSNLCTDSRKVQKGDLFWALKGENFDGNAFAKTALEKGAKYAIIDNPQYQTEGTILVHDALKALQDLATHHRKQFQMPVIGITGSNGKTTTKELVMSILAKKYNLLATKGNLNNHIGVPLTVLNLRAEHELALIELGGNHIGEVAELCEISRPTYAIITNVGEDHLEGFGSIEGVIEALSELYNFVIEQNGTGVMNAADPILCEMAKNFEKAIYYGLENQYSNVRLLEASPYIVYQDEKGNVVRTQLVGKYNLDNIQTAICLGKIFGISPEKANEAISEYVPKNNRSQVIEGKYNLLISDAYNANPSSMKVALESFSQTQKGKRTAILGDMFEMGKYSASKHTEIIEYAQSLEIEQIIVCGQNFHEAWKPHYHKVKAFASKTSLAEYLSQNPIRNETILLKGSRGMALETLYEYL